MRTKVPSAKPWHLPLSAHPGAAPAAGRRKGRRPPLRPGDGWAPRSDSGRAPATNCMTENCLKSEKTWRNLDMTACSSFGAVALPETRVWRFPWTPWLFLVMMTSSCCASIPQQPKHKPQVFKDNIHCLFQVVTKSITSHLQHAIHGPWHF